MKRFAVLVIALGYVICAYFLPLFSSMLFGVMHPQVYPTVVTIYTMVAVVVGFLVHDVFSSTEESHGNPIFNAARGQSPPVGFGLQKLQSEVIDQTDHTSS